MATATRRPSPRAKAGKQAKATRVAKPAAILKAATQLFLERGYAKTTMDDIAARAQVTKQTVYAHYHNKNQLFTQMLEGICNQHAPLEIYHANPNRSFESLLTEVGLGFLDSVTSPEGLGTTRLVVAESGSYPKLAQLYYENGSQCLVSALAHFLDHQNARGVIQIENTVSAASYFVTMLKGQYFLKMILRIKPAPNQSAKVKHVEECVRIFMRVYGGDAPLVTHSTI